MSDNRRGSTAAERQRKYRERRRVGRRVLQIEIDDVGLSDALVEAGYLQEWDMDDPASIDAAIMVMLNDLAKRNA